MRFSASLGLLAGLISALLASGCSSTASVYERARSLYPVERADAAVALGASGDLQAVPTLVGLLEDNDRAVRMYAIGSLERLTGQTHGYQFYAPEPARAEAVRRWQDSLREGRLTARAGVTSPAEPAAPAAGGAP